jgi:glycerol kinase
MTAGGSFPHRRPGNVTVPRVPADPVILALDQGSSSTRCIAYDARLDPVAAAVRRVETSRPGPGMVEHDPDALLAGALEAIAEARAAAGRDVAGVGIANQTETFVLWERDGGRAVTPMLSWQDQRAEELCRSLAGHPGAERVAAVTGLALDPTFSAPKLAWLFGRDPALLARARAGELAFGDVACWLAWHLSAGAGHVTEPSNACRSLVLDVESMAWDAALLDLFGVPAPILPEVRDSDASGLRTAVGVAGFDAPVAAMLGDQPAALYGQGCTSPRMAALTLGTGAFVWLNAGPARPDPPGGVLATVAWQTAREGCTYALEAFGANAGNALGVLRASGIVPADWPSRAPAWDSPHPVVVPAPAGLGTPHWHGADRVTMLGASSATTAEDVAAAWLAGVAHQIADALEAQSASGGIDVLRVGGGLAADRVLLQAVADLSGLVLEAARDLEATARGIAALAAAAAGVLDPAASGHAVAHRVEPRLDAAGRARERDRWREALAVHVQPQAPG